MEAALGIDPGYAVGDSPASGDSFLCWRAPEGDDFSKSAPRLKGFEFNQMFVPLGVPVQSGPD
jgi:hypothetical protein